MFYILTLTCDRWLKICQTAKKVLSTNWCWQSSTVQNVWQLLQHCTFCTVWQFLCYLSWECIRVKKCTFCLIQNSFFFKMTVDKADCCGRGTWDDDTKALMQSEMASRKQIVGALLKFSSLLLSVSIATTRTTPGGNNGGAHFTCVRVPRII